MKLWEGLEQDLNYNAMVSQRGVLNLFHSDAQRDAYARRGNAMRLQRHRCRAARPRAACGSSRRILDFDNARFPIQGGLLQRRGGTARHDAVVWGYARAADTRGVDIIQNCEVTGITRRRRARRRRRDDARHHRRQQGRHGGGRQLVARRGDGGPAAADREPRAAGLRHRGHQAADRHGVITFGAGHFYVSQSDKGGLVFGGDIDGYNSYAQRGNLPVVEDVVRGRHGADARSSAALRMLRHWGGIMDMSMDGSPIIDRTPVDGPLSQRRLVLRRLQGDARLGLVLRPSASRATSRTR